jgi:hypothetical protein
MDQKSQQLLLEYEKEVKKTARTVYLQAEAIKKELNLSVINPEDKDTIILHVIGMLVEKK